MSDIPISQRILQSQGQSQLIRSEACFHLLEQNSKALVICFRRTCYGKEEGRPRPTLDRVMLGFRGRPSATCAVPKGERYGVLSDYLQLCAQTHCESANLL